MSVIVVKCTDQVLTFENTPIITSGGRGENFVKFSFCKQWDGFTKTAVFWRNEHEPYHALLDKDNACTIPYEVLTKDGRFYFGVFGVNAGYERRTSEVLAYLVAKGAITEGTQPSDPTPEIYDKLLAEYAATQDKYNEAMDAMAQRTAELQQTVEDCTSNMQQTVEDCTSNLNQTVQQHKQALDRKYDEAIQATEDCTKALQDTVVENAVELNAKYDQALNALGYSRDDTITDAVRAKYGVGSDAVPADVFSKAYEMIRGKVQMEIIAYRGTGTAGKSNPTSVTFSAAPSVIVMLGYRDVDSGRWYQVFDPDGDFFTMLPTEAIPTEYTRGMGFGRERNYYIYGKKSSDGKTFSWYSYDNATGDGTAAEQCNESDNEYYILGLVTGAVSSGGNSGSGDSGNSGDNGGSGGSADTITATIDEYGNITVTAGVTWLEYIAADGAGSGFYIDNDNCVRLDDWYVNSDGETAVSSDEIVQGIYYLSEEMEGGE